MEKEECYPVYNGSHEYKIIVFTQELSSLHVDEKGFSNDDLALRWKAKDAATDLGHMAMKERALQDYCQAR